MSAGGTDRPKVGTTRDRLLAAAQELFGERGFDGSSTREIADRAGVSEPMLFRHFGTKANLFEIATIEPCIAFMQSYVADWHNRDRPGAMLDEAREFYTGLFDVLHSQRELLTALLAAHRFGRVQADVADRLHATFRDAMAMFQQVLETEVTANRSASVDHAAAVRLVVGMVLSVVLHDDWLMGNGLDRERMLDEMSRLTVLGLLPRA